jgi:RNA polymerase sigma-70 factor (ECF subfamily)
VQDAKNGDRSALDELIRRHLPGLCAFVRLQLGGTLRARESASDIAQSVCREVLEQLDRFDSGGDEGFRRWLFTTAMRKIRDRAAYWRAQRRDAARDQPIDVDDALAHACREITSPSAAAGGKELVDRIERAFDGLAEDDREVILLSRVLGLPHDEIARQTGRSEGACRVLLHRALGKLARMLDAPDDPPTTPSTPRSPRP